MLSVYLSQCDIWTETHSFISLSAHWIANDKYKLQDYILSSSFFPEAHTVIHFNIASKMTEMMDEWEIEPERRSVLVRDGASNMVLGADLAELEDVHCNIHLLQLCVEKCAFLIPKMLWLKSVLDKAGDIRGVGTMVKAMKESVNSRFFNENDGLKLDLYHCHCPRPKIQILLQSLTTGKNQASAYPEGHQL